jgi:hypothetical protein
MCPLSHGVRPLLLSLYQRPAMVVADLPAPCCCSPCLDEKQPSALPVLLARAPCSCLPHGCAQELLSGPPSSMSMAWSSSSHSPATSSSPSSMAPLRTSLSMATNPCALLCAAPLLCFSRRALCSRPLAAMAPRKIPQPNSPSRAPKQRPPCSIAQARAHPLALGSLERSSSALSPMVVQPPTPRA